MTRETIHSRYGWYLQLPSSTRGCPDSSVTGSPSPVSFVFLRLVDTERETARDGTGVPEVSLERNEHPKLQAAARGERLIRVDAPDDETASSYLPFI